MKHKIKALDALIEFASGMETDKYSKRKKKKEEPKECNEDKED